MEKQGKSRKSTSWEPVAPWYKGIVGDEGHYFHKQIILPGVKRLLKSSESVLDLACGNGILSRQLLPSIQYHGIDLSPSLIKEAKQNTKSTTHSFSVADITNPLITPAKAYSSAVCILAVQNLSEPKLAFQNAFNALVTKGIFIIVINHPCFRIPRQSSWQIDDVKKIQYRRIDRYMSPLEVPIQTHPGKSSTLSTLSYHHPLTDYVSWLNSAGFFIDTIEEWCSDKESTGKAARMENRARDEFPLFMAIRSIKL